MPCRSDKNVSPQPAGRLFSSVAKLAAMRLHSAISQEVSMVDAPDTATFTALNKKFAEAIKSHDFTALESMFTDNSVLLAPGGNIIAGKANIATFWEQRARRLHDIEFDTVTVNPVGADVVRAMGTFSMRMEGGQALLGEQTPPRETSCKYLFLWQKTGGHWKLETSVWNRIGAPPGRGWRLGQYTAGGAPGAGQGPGRRNERRGQNQGKPPGFPVR
jgi:ketosteroid isomerase-like protein